jgi:glutamate transport system ATP-binding protein
MAVDPLIELRDVNKDYGELPVLQNISPTRIKVRKKERADRRSREFLDRVGLASQADEFPAQFSGGRQHHEMGFARSAANRVVSMSDGRVIENRTPDEFFTDPRTDRARDFLSQILEH